MWMRSYPITAQTKNKFVCVVAFILSKACWTNFDVSYRRCSASSSLYLAVDLPFDIVVRHYATLTPKSFSRSLRIPNGANRLLPLWLFFFLSPFKSCQWINWPSESVCHLRVQQMTGGKTNASYWLDDWRTDALHVFMLSRTVSATGQHLSTWRHSVHSSPLLHLCPSFAFSFFFIFLFSSCFSVIR